MSLCVCWGGGGGGCGERRQERKYCHPDRYIKITGDYIVKGVSFRYEEHGGLNFMNLMLTPNGRDLAHSCLVKRI